MTFFETIQFWWQVKQYNRKLLKQAREADKTPYDITPESINDWIATNPFGVTKEELNISHLASTPSAPVIAFKKTNYGN